MAYSPEERDALQGSLCIHIMEGKSLRSWCEQSDCERPAMSTVFSWLETDDAFRSKYARAREVQAEVLVDEMIDIADDDSGDIKTVRGKDGAPTIELDRDNVARAKLRLEQRRWTAEKLLPKKYGAKVDLLGGSGGGVKRVTVEFTGADDE